MEEKNDKYPEGHFIAMWMGIGIALFTGLGVSLSIALKIPGVLGIGPATGVALGLSIGLSIESKYKKEGKIRPLTKDEKRKRNILLIGGVVILILGCILGLSMFLF